MTTAASAQPTGPAMISPAPHGASGHVPHFGLYLPQQRLTIGQIEETVRAAEALGFHSAWLMDHGPSPVGSDEDLLEGWTVAAALARRTDRIRLGHLVLGNGFRHPALLARMAATLDVVSEGRFDLGLAWGSDGGHHDVADEVPRRHAGRLAETVEILQRMFAGELFSFRGDHYELERAVGRPRPVRGVVPLHIGSVGRRATMPLVARYADWWACPAHAVPRLADLRPLAGSARVSVHHPIGLASSRSHRHEVIDEARRVFGDRPGQIAGTPSEIARALTDEARSGVEMFVLQFSDLGSPQTLRLFAREVMPAVRAALAAART